MRFDIRRKEYPFMDAPVFDGVNQGYEALTAAYYGGAVTAVSRHGTAMGAAQAAAAEAYRLNHSGQMGTTAWVRGFWTGERPTGIMKRMMPVSYRARE